MKNKLLFVIRSLSGGGAERVISNLANHFSANGYKVTLICLNKDDIKYTISPLVCVKSLVERSNKHSFLYRGYYAFVTFVKLLVELYREKPSCCISFMTSVNIWTGLCASILRINYIVSERTSPYYTIEKLNKVTKWITSKIYANAKAVVLPSKKMIKTFHSLEYFKHLHNLSTIYNPVHVFDRPIGGEVHPRPFVLSVGRLDYDKRFDLLIEAFAELKCNDLDLLISGIGSHEQILLNKIVEHGLESRVKLIGFKSNLQDYYTKAKLFVSASRVEGYPNALVEAMSLGCPVIATDCDYGPSEIIENGINGFLVEVDNKEELVAAMHKVLGDSDLQVKFSKNGRRKSVSNSFANIAKEWNKLIES